MTLLKHKAIIDSLYETMYEPWMDEQDRIQLREGCSKQISDELLNDQIENCIELLKIPEDKVKEFFVKLFHKLRSENAKLS